MPRKSGPEKLDVKIKNTDKAKRPEKAKKDIMAGIDPEDLIFALDIGTRTVVGILGIEEKSKFKVLAAEVLEHKSRAMMDGQIHDISKVAEIADILKKRIEKTIGRPLTKVAIAAAGRVLKTCEITVERELDQIVEIDKEMVSSLEMQAIQDAQLKLESDVSREEKNQFYCVGYSVINYCLNGYVISSLVGHKGKKISLSILATFLPHVVVDSLYTVMNRIGLEVVNMTLEPIAAINVTIPVDLRLLNLALVDIGAGTSDIAITKDGSVVAYSMVPIAGDEITEKIAHHYLVDFNTGERIKTALTSKKQTIDFLDILGKKQVIELKDVNELISPGVEHLAKTISQRIIEYNSKAPNAVFLIGGGSQIPGISKKIAESLGLPEERVVVRGRDIIQNIRYSGKKLSGPESITPFGIAVTALLQRGQDFLVVKVNGQKLRIFNSRKLTVADALVLIGFDAERLIGRSGKSVNFELNGKRQTIKGEYGKPAEIYVNDKTASLETELKMDDDIKVIPAERGRDASVKIGGIIKSFSKGRIVLNGIEQEIGTKVLVNGIEKFENDAIEDGDIINVSGIITLKDLIGQNEIDIEYYDVFVDGRIEQLDYQLESGESIECVVRFSQNAPNDEAARENVDVNSDYINKSGIGIDEHVDAKLYNKPVNGISDLLYVTLNGKEMTINSKKNGLMFVEIFNYIDFDISKPQGSIVLKLNGRQAGFTDLIRSGDAIEIYWDK